MSAEELRFGLSPRRRILIDVLLIALVVALTIAVSAHAPSDLYAYAQVWQMGSAIDVLQGDSHWLLPRTQTGAIYRKPLVYPYLAAAAVRLTGSSSDFVLRLPTVLSTFATALLIYVIGRRWYGRGTAVLGACMWAAMLHMSRMSYLATTDMLLTLWITLSLLCVDRILLHPSSRRGWWTVVLWASMILGALSKGWGLVNLALVGLFVAMAAPLVLRSPEDRGVGTVRLVLRRWWRAARRLHLGWGLPAMAAVIVPVWAAKLAVGGEEFRRVVYFEVIQRITGQGESPPKATSAPPVLHLLYYTLPASVFGLGAVLLRLPRVSHLRRLRTTPLRRCVAGLRIWLRRCFRRSSPTCLPLCWTLAVVLPFSLAHGFRPDYLLPCYGAVALAGAWAAGRLQRLGPLRGRSASILRHSFAAIPLLTALTVFLVPWIYLLHRWLPTSWADEIDMPAYVAPGTWLLTAGCVGVGAVCLPLVVRSSLSWRLRRLAAVGVVVMIPFLFLYTHFISRHAVTGDGETMVRFARSAENVVGDEEFAVYRVQRLGVEPLLGRFGDYLSAGPGVTCDPADAEEAAERVIDQINESSAPWLFTCDRGLLELGAARPAGDGLYRIRLPGGKRRFEIRPGELGMVSLTSPPVVYQNWGRIYLIRVKRPVEPSGRPVATGHIPGYQELDE
ncbi:MAG: ArnT family glycosyltransferase [Phycisphaerae bacterium]